MSRKSRLFVLGSPLFFLGVVILIAVLLCPGVALGISDFSDVKPGDDYSEAIADLSSLGIINGFDDRTFRPKALVTRQQFAKMIVLALGLQVTENDICPFSDVERGGADDLYPDNFVAVCASNNITKGTNQAQTLFSPYRNITRAQVMSMVVRAAPIAGITLEPPTSAYYDDLKRVMRNFDDPTHGLNAHIAEVNSLLWGVRPDSVGVWDPWKNATRGEVAQILWRLRQKIPTTNLLAYDEFSDPNTGWSEATYDNSTMRYTDGFYRIGITASDTQTASWWGQVFDDVYYEAWAWPTPDSGDWEYGLAFRVQDMNNLYELSVRGDDTARLWKSVGGDWTLMSPRFDLPPAASDGWRHLEVTMVGDSFTGYVDGVQVGEFTDGTFTTGKAGFYVETFDATDFAVFFDYFAVWRIVY